MQYIHLNDVDSVIIGYEFKALSYETGYGETDTKFLL